MTHQSLIAWLLSGNIASLFAYVTSPEPHAYVAACFRYTLPMVAMASGGPVQFEGTILLLYGL